MMTIVKTGDKQWQNELKTFKVAIKDLYDVANDGRLGPLQRYNDTTEGIKKLIGEAIATNTPLRFLGSGWSWTKIAAAENGVMVNTKLLNQAFTLTAGSVSAAYKGDVKQLYFAQCGNGIWELNDDLRKNNPALSLKTCGASNGQTIVGAMSTGAHGATIDVGGVQDYVVGMHIITGPDRHIWLERKSAPVVSASFVKLFNTELVQDDELFNAALVSFGCFGCIHGVLLETEPLFLLETNMQRVPYGSNLKKAMETLDFSTLALPGGTDRPFHFSVSINPYDLDNGAFLYTHYKRPYREDYVRPKKNDAGLGPGSDAPAFIGTLTKVLPKSVPLIVNKLIGGALKPYSKQFGTLGEIFDNTDLRGKLTSTALGLPLNKVNRVAALLLEINKTSGPFTGIFAFRYVKKSNATLGFTQFGDFTCVLELDGIFSSETDKFYRAVWKRLDDEKIPYTFHWGKENEINPDKMKTMYGKKTDSWIAARNKLLKPEMIKVFNNPLIAKWGLDKIG
jgi:FAD binding domain